MIPLKLKNVSEKLYETKVVCFNEIVNKNYFRMFFYYFQYAEKSLFDININGLNIDVQMKIIKSKFHSLFLKIMYLCVILKNIHGSKTDLLFYIEFSRSI